MLQINKYTSSHQNLIVTLSDFLSSYHVDSFLSVPFSQTNIFLSSCFMPLRGPSLTPLLTQVTPAAEDQRTIGECMTNIDTRVFEHLITVRNCFKMTQEFALLWTVLISGIFVTSFCHFVTYNVLCRQIKLKLIKTW